MCQYNSSTYRCVAAPTPTPTPTVKPTPTPTPATYAGWCQASGMTLPSKFPNQTTCNSSSNNGCNGWQPVGAKIVNQIGYDQTFSYQAGDTLCLYSYRANTSGKSPASDNPVLCYNTKSCNVCAFSSMGSATPPTTFADLNTPPGIDNCQECHYSGPVLPNQALWNAVEGSAVGGAVTALNLTCASTNGPNFVGTSWDKPNAANKVASPSECSGCHTNGFVKSLDACDIIRLSFAKTGSMKDKFQTNKQCTDFLKSMDCSESLIDCPTPSPSSTPTPTPTPTITSAPSRTPTPRPSLSPSPK